MHMLMHMCMRMRILCTCGLCVSSLVLAPLHKVATLHVLAWLVMRLRGQMVVWAHGSSMVAHVVAWSYHVLLGQMDAFVVHGGLGTTVEALRMKKPTVVTGLLLMDQRFWGGVVADKGIGPKPTHIDVFNKGACVKFVDGTLCSSHSIVSLCELSENPLRFFDTGPKLACVHSPSA